MFKIQTLNKISPLGLDLFPRDNYEVATEFVNPDGILVRSFKMNDMEFPQSLKAIARAGAGVNNINIPKCSDKGIVVFNTPGANANAVKELVLTGLFLSSRKIFQAMSWATTLIGKGDAVPKLIEDGKSKFEGPEIRGKRLGVIGLGAIGVLVANDAHALGMKVSGYDTNISIDAAWGLSNQIKKATSLDSIFANSDYITIHVPLDDKTKGMLNAEKFAIMKKGVRLLNFSRGGLVNNNDLKKAIEDKIVEAYVTDFPDEELLKTEGVINIPHLGASTPEAEDNCAIMAVNQIKDFLETGNIKNSVNFPECRMDKTKNPRIIIANRNIPNMVGQVTTILAEEKINIADLLNKHRDELAYNIIDVDNKPAETTINKLKAVEGIIMVRLID